MGKAAERRKWYREGIPLRSWGPSLVRSLGLAWQK